MHCGSGMREPRRRGGRTVAGTVVVAVVAVTVALALAPVAGVASAAGGPASPGSGAAPTAAGDATGSLSGPATVPAAATAPTGAAQQDVDADQVFMRVDLRPDGDARWDVEYRILLGDDDERAAFEGLQEDVRTNTSAYVDAFRDDVTGTVAQAENATGREMSAGNVSVATDTQTFGRSYGVVTYSYTWRNFSAVEGDRVRAGDALAGLFLDGSTSLRVGWPDGYAASQVRPDATDRSENYVVWEGERSFGTGEPRVVIAPEDGDGLAATSPLVIGGGLAVVVTLVAGGAWALRRRSAGETLPGTGADAGDGPATAASGGATAAGAASGAGSTDGTAASGAEAAPDDGAADDDSGSGGDAGDSARDDASESSAGDDEETAGEPPEELLSNEERVLRLLRENGGRAKQQQIVEELGWTAAKTSQVVNGMRDDGRIEGFRLGRENVLRLPEGDDVDDETGVNSDESG